MPRPIAFALLPLVLLACSGNAVIEPGAQTTKRAKAYIEKCQPAAPPDGTGELKEVYACLPPEEACPEPGAAETKTELGYVLNKADDCGNSTVVFDVPCGPDLNAIDCCYVARVKSVEGGCD
jgi:hypothetical protein